MKTVLIVTLSLLALGIPATNGGPITSTNEGTGTNGGENTGINSGYPHPTYIPPGGSPGGAMGGASGFGGRPALTGVMIPASGLNGGRGGGLRRPMGFNSFNGGRANGFRRTSFFG